MLRQVHAVVQEPPYFNFAIVRMPEQEEVLGVQSGSREVYHPRIGMNQGMLPGYWPIRMQRNLLHRQFNQLIVPRELIPFARNEIVINLLSIVIPLK